MSVRPATFGDVPALAAMHVAAWRAAYDGLLPQALLDSLQVSEREQMWQNALRQPGEEVFIYERAGQPVAFGSLGRQRDEDKDDATTKELYTLYALPEAWGQGVGRMMWLRMLESLQTQAIQEVSLWVLKGNERGISFYEKAGFKPDGEEKLESWRSHKLHELRYIRPLSAALNL